MEKILLTDLHRQYDSIKGEIDEAIADVIAQKSFIRGPFVEQFETNFARATNIPYCIGVGNGTDALFIALKTLGIGPGDEVITAANGFIATPEAITMTGAKVVFADCDNYFGIDPKDITRKISSRTKAIIPVHLYGQMAEMDAIMAIAGKHGLFVIEDSAQAVLASYNGTPAGGYGHFATFSFFPGKNLGAYGDAGALVTTDKELYTRAKMYANHGRVNKYDHKFEGINSRMDGIQGAILNVKLKYLSRWTEKRIEIASRYSSLLDSVKGIELPMQRAGAHHVFHIYPILTEPALRDKLLEFLNNAGIGAGIHYPIALPNLEAYRYLGHKPEDFPNASEFSHRLISLPIFPELKDTEIDFIVRQINNFYERDAS
ncbi:MAG: DegT/DnrJ/EryC1/StrS family aminotransferase [Bacteroidota bacterium]